MGADLAAEFRDFHVFHMDGIRIKGGAICKDRNQSSIVRSRQVNGVKANGQTLNLWNDGGQLAEEGDMFIARKLLNVISILPNDYVCQHFLCLLLSSLKIRN